MPNWVYNNVTLTGSLSDLSVLKRALALPAPIQMSGLNPPLVYDFNFHSLSTPEEEIWEEYNGPSLRTTNLEESLKFATNHWYDWNIRNWGCKWGPSETVATDNFDQDDLESYTLTYHFDTPWSPPERIIYALSAKIEELKLDVEFEWYYEEEQGWGGVIVRDKDGNTFSAEEWDIPNSHEELVARKGECYCIDGEFVFDDCPIEEARPIEEEN